MALDLLATAADLSTRGTPTDDAGLVSAMLEAASAAVREAAGSVITRTSSVVTLEAPMGPNLSLPFSPVRGVSDVSIDGEAVTDYTLVSGRLWRASGWLLGCGPSLVTMTVDHGVDVAPADLVDLVCSLAAAGVAAAADGYDPKRGMAYERIDDYQYGLRQGDDEVVNPMILPERTRLWLRQRFGGGSYVTGVVQ